jgi:hypothetical protein
MTPPRNGDGHCANSNQALLDTRWGEAPFTDYSAPVNDRSAAAGR